MTRKILTIDDCRACPYGKKRTFSKGLDLKMEIRCGLENKVIGNWFVGRAVAIPEWCPLVDSNDVYDALLDAVSNMNAKKSKGACHAEG